MCQQLVSVTFSCSAAHPRCSRRLTLRESVRLSSTSQHGCSTHINPPWQGNSAFSIFVQVFAHLHAALFRILPGNAGKLAQPTMDHASEIENAPDADQDAALLCSVSDQMHLDAHQVASVFAPHPSCGRFRSTAATARCRLIGESSTNDTGRDSCKVQSYFFANRRFSHEEPRSPPYVLQVGVSVRMTGSVIAHPVQRPHALQSSLCAVPSHDRSRVPVFSTDSDAIALQRHVLGKSQQSKETHHSANCPCCSGSITTGGKHATARTGSATPTRLSAQPAGLQRLLQAKPACNPASQTATCTYSSLPSKGSHPLPRGSRKTRCTNLVHSTPLSANTATMTKQKPRSAASPASSMFPPSPTERGPRSAAKPAYSRHHSPGQVRGEKADSAAEAELNALRQENAKLQSQVAHLRSLRSQEEAARDSVFSPDMPQVSDSCLLKDASLWAPL